MLCDTLWNVKCNFVGVMGLPFGCIQIWLFGTMTVDYVGNNDFSGRETVMSMSACAPMTMPAGVHLHRSTRLGAWTRLCYALCATKDTTWLSLLVAKYLWRKLLHYIMEFGVYMLSALHVTPLKQDKELEEAFLSMFCSYLSIHPLSKLLIFREVAGVQEAIQAVWTGCQPIAGYSYFQSEKNGKEK